MVNIIKDASLADFLLASDEVLYAHEDRNNLLIGLLEPFRGKVGPITPYFVRVTESGKTVACAAMVPNRNLILTEMSNESVDALVSFLHGAGVTFPGIIGPFKTVEYFGLRWSVVSKAKLEVGMSQHLLRAELVKLPSPVSGELSLASADQAEHLANWLFEFDLESIPKHEHRSLDQWREHARLAIEKGVAYFWKDEDQIRSMAILSRATRNGISIGGVYSPKTFRGRGYASNLVAQLTLSQLKAGKKFCVLYTDASNPTSNKIYRNIGYREVMRSLVLAVI